MDLSVPQKTYHVAGSTAIRPHLVLLILYSGHYGTDWQEESHSSWDLDPTKHSLQKSLKTWFLSGGQLILSYGFLDTCPTGKLDLELTGWAVRPDLWANFSGGYLKSQTPRRRRGATPKYSCQIWSYLKMGQNLDNGCYMDRSRSPEYQGSLFFEIG